MKSSRLLVVALALMLSGVGCLGSSEDEELDDEPDYGQTAPLVHLLYREGPGANYTFQVYRVSYPVTLENIQYFIKNENGHTRCFGPVAIQNRTHTDGDYEVEGIEAYSTWSMKNHSAKDYELLRERAMDVENGTRFYRIIFYDNDYDDLLSHGDVFLLRGKQHNGTTTHNDIHEGWSFDLTYQITSDIISSRRLI